MYAVFRETHYSSEIEIQESKAFKEFHDKHAEQLGYIGTVVAKVDNIRHLTITLWKTEEDMDNARKKLGEVVEQTIDPLMVSPAILIGTGPVILSDLSPNTL